MYTYESYVNVVDLRTNTPKTNSKKLEIRPKKLDNCSRINHEHNWEKQM
jgi:hypothetical protein